MDSLVRAAQNRFKELSLKGLRYYASIEVEKHISKKNAYQVTGRGNKHWMRKASNITNAEDIMVLQMRQQAIHQKIYAPIGSDLHCMYVFYFRDYYNKGTFLRNKKLNDLSNLIELPSDCLKTAGIIGDDCQICSFDGTRRMPSDRNYIEIFIMDYEDVLP